MKKALLAFYCAVLFAISACSGPLLDIPFEYGSAPRKETSPLILTQAIEETSEFDAAIEQADESLSGEEQTMFRDLSVVPLGNAPSEPVSEFSAYLHYIEYNEPRYHSFMSYFPELSASLSLALVNINADYGYYNGISTTEDPADLLVLCNKNFQLPSDYVPKGLRGVAGTSYQMTAGAATAFEDMKQALKDDLGLPLTILSGYRSYSYQKTLYGRYAAADGAAVADTYSARAGHSEHQTGLAIDFLHRSPSGSLRKAGFQNTAQYEWLLVHAHEYGFILRYPEGYEQITGYRFEPWHWRYIGAEDATRMFSEGFVTFEEYIGTYFPPQTAVILEAG